MKYSKLAKLYEDLESTTKNLKKRDILSEFLKNTEDSELEIIVLFVNGQIFPSVSEEVLGIADKMIIKTLEKISGVGEKRINQLWRERGDLGLVAEEIVKKKTQTTLSSKELSIEYVITSLREMSRIEGKSSNERKLSYLSKLLSSAEPKEARYIIRTVLGTLRIGMGFGNIRDAISKAFSVDAKNVQRAYELTSDLSEIALMAKNQGDGGLKKLSISIGKPLQLMLYQKASGIANGFKRVGKPSAIEYKYDGIRVQCHKNEKKVALFTRRLENVTKQFPEIEKYIKDNVNCKKCIIEGEAVAYNPRTKNYVPFQELGKRIKRKYDIERIAKEVPVVLYLFDILFLDNNSLLKEAYEKRRNTLKIIIKESKWKIELAKQLQTSSEKSAQEFYKKALEMGHEGVMMKNIKAEYSPGSRVGYGVKVKPIMETLDLIITGAIWGEGKRSRWLSSFILSCAKDGELVEIGKMATGLSEEQFEEITKRLKPLITKTKGKRVDVKPKIIVEVGYEEIQKSPTYSSGFALRFPRLIRFRDDKESADDIEKVRNILNSS